MLNHSALRTIGGVALIGALVMPQVTHAQRPNDRQYPYDRQGRYNAYQRLAQIEPGTYITVRTRQSIDATRRDGRVFAGSVDQDVWDDYRRLAVPAIPRGSAVELVVRSARDGDLILDLESILVGGQRYAVEAIPERIDSESGRRPDSGDTAAYVGGGAVLGSIIGAIAGGGKGAAVGAAVGAAAGGVTVATQGRRVRVPAGSLLTFRLDRGLTLGVSRNRPAPRR